MAAAERQNRRQVAVEAQGIDRQNGIGCCFGIEARVVGGDVDFTAGKRHRRLAPDHVIKASRAVFVAVGVAEPVERPP